MPLEATGVFKWSESTESIKGTAVAGFTSNSQGSGVALSADGLVLVVGERERDGPTYTDQGAVATYDWSGGTWVQRGTLLTVEGTATDFWFGADVALSADGEILAVGVAGYSDPNLKQGAVYIFDRSGSTWVQRGTPLVAPTPTASAQFGRSVCLAESGTTLIVGEIESATASIYTYDYSGSWSQRGSALTRPLGTEQKFVYRLAATRDGNALIVGGNDASNNQGFFTYDRSGSAWVQRGSFFASYDSILAVSGVEAETFYGGLAITDDGQTVYAGAENYDTGALPWTEAVLRFDTSGSSWVFNDTVDEQDRNLITAAIPNLPLYYAFGTAVAVDSSATKLVVGAPDWNNADYLLGDYAGAAFTFALEEIFVEKAGPTTTVRGNVQINSPGFQFQQIADTRPPGPPPLLDSGKECAMSRDGLVMVINHDYGGTNGVGRIVTFDWDGAGWVYRTGADVNNADLGEYRQGWSDWSNFTGGVVALNGDGTVLVIGSQKAGTNPADNKGRANVLTSSGGAWTETQVLSTPLVANRYSEDFGSQVSISDDAAVIGIIYDTYYDSNPGDIEGLAVFYDWNGGSYIERTGGEFEFLYNGNDFTTYAFGGIALNGDGTTMVVCGYDTYFGYTKAEVHDWNGSAWVKRGTTLYSTAASEYGFALVGMSASGDTVYTASPNVGWISSGTVAAYIEAIDWSGSAWVRRSPPISPVFTVYGRGWFQNQQWIGQSGSISADEKRIVVKGVVGESGVGIGDHVIVTFAEAPTGGDLCIEKITDFDAGLVVVATYCIQDPAPPTYAPDAPNIPQPPQYPNTPNPDCQELGEFQIMPVTASFANANTEYQEFIIETIWEGDPWAHICE